MTNQSMNYMTSPQVAIVSGGSRGLGKAFTEALLAEGWSVATFARRATDFTYAAQTDPELANRFHFQEMDIRDGVGCDKFVADVVARWGKLDLLVNNAGIAGWAPMLMAEDEYIDEHVNINLGGALRLTRGGAKQMMRQRWGRIINISSVTGIVGFGGIGPYAATKAAMDGLTRSLAIEMGSSNVTVNALAPGYIPTDMTKRFPPEILNWNRDNTAMKRLGSIEDFVPPFMFLVSEGARYITGHTLVVDGGLTI
jgi:3-oxoacyl-[acyl-carrier protein] reductase